MDEYLVERILEAEKCIYDLNWQNDLAVNPIHRDKIRKENIAKQMEQAIEKRCRQGVETKQIFTFSNMDNYHKMKKRISYGDNYSCSCYLQSNSFESNFPKLSFTIIDEEEIIFTSFAYQYYCAIKDKELVKIWGNYFDQGWRFSTKIKLDGKINETILNQIAESLGRFEDECL